MKRWLRNILAGMGSVLEICPAPRRSWTGSSPIELVGGPRDGELLDWPTDRDTFEFVMLPKNRLHDLDEDFQERCDVRKGTYRYTGRLTPRGRRIFRWQG